MNSGCPARGDRSRACPAMNALSEPDDRLTNSYRRGLSLLRLGELDDEPRSAARPVLDPDRAVVMTNMLRDQREPEPAPTVPSSLSGLDAAGEAFEHPLPQIFGHARSGVVDLEARASVAPGDRHPHRPSCVPVSVVEQVGDGPIEPASVALDQERRLLDLDRRWRLRSYVENVA